MEATYSKQDFGTMFVGGTNTTLQNQNIWESGKILPATIATIKKAYQVSIPQVKGLAAILKASSFEQSCFNIYDFITRNIRYKKDTPGFEEVRTAARSWKDRKTGVDCEDYAILAGALLSNMGYTPKFEIVAFGAGYAHIFAVAYHNGKSIVIDCTPYQDGLGPVVPFNTRPSGITQTMQVELLNGLNIGSIPMVAGIGGIHPKSSATQKLMDVQSSLIDAEIKGIGAAWMPGKLRAVRTGILLNGLDDQDVYLGALPFISDVKANGNMIFQPGLNQDDVVELGEYLGVLDAWKQTGYNKALKMADLEGIGGIQFDRDHENANDYLIEGIGSWLSRKVKKLKSKVSTVVNTVKKVGKTYVKAVKWAGKNIAKGIKAFVKNPLYFINKINPATIVVRNSILAVLRLNLFKLSSKIKFGYLTEEEAKKRGYNLDEWKKLHKLIGSMENIFDKLGGEKSNLKNAIIKGGHGLGSIGEPATATAAAASTPIILKIVQWLKAIDFKSMFGKNPSKDEVEASTSLSEPTEQQVQNTVPTTDQNASTYNSESEVPVGQKMASKNLMPTLRPGEEDPGDQETNTPSSSARMSTSGSTDSNSTWLYVGAAAGFALLMLAR